VCTTFIVSNCSIVPARRRLLYGDCIMRNEVLNGSYSLCKVDSTEEIEVE